MEETILDIENRDISESDKIDIIMNCMDSMFHSDQFKTVDDVIELINENYEEYSLTTILTVLTMSYPAKKRLRNRSKLFEKSVRKYKHENEKSDGMLFHGLE